MATPPPGAHPVAWQQEMFSSQEAVVVAEREMAVQAVLYLYDHLTYFEQWREAAALLAFALPHNVRADKRIEDVMGRAAKLAAKIETPEAERDAGDAIGVFREVAGLARDLASTPPRALYWRAVCRLARVTTALDYGTGGGIHLLQLAALEPGVHWVGVDLSGPQMEFSQAEARRLGLTNVDFMLEEEALVKHGHSVDSVGVHHVLEHTVHPDAVLARAEAFLRPGGTMCLTMPNGPWSVHLPPSTDREATVGHGGHVAVESPQTLTMRLAARGRILDLRIAAGPVEAEGNSCIQVCYEPGPPTINPLVGDP